MSDGMPGDDWPARDPRCSHCRQVEPVHLIGCPEAPEEKARHANHQVPHCPTCTCGAENAGVQP